MSLFGEKRTLALRPHAKARRPRLTHALRKVRPPTQQLSCVARVDDCLGVEALGGSERRTQSFGPGANFGQTCFRIGMRSEFGLERRFNAAFERQRAPIA